MKFIPRTMLADLAKEHGFKIDGNHRVTGTFEDLEKMVRAIETNTRERVSKEITLLRNWVDAE